MKKDIISQLQEMKTLSPLYQQLVTREGFFHLYEELFPLMASRREAYEFLECRYEEVVGARKYAEYDVFRRVYRNFLKKRR